MEVEMRESYRALKSEMGYISDILSAWNLYRATWKGEATKKETEKLLQFVSAVDSVIEAIDVYQSDVDYILWMDKIIEIIKPAYDKLSAIKQISDNHSDIMMVQESIGLINIKRGVHDPKQQLFFMYYVLSKLMNVIKVAKDNITQTIPNKPIKDKLTIKEIDPLSLTHKNRLPEFKKYESILKDRIPLWKEKKFGALAECAAFCDYLHSKNIIRKDLERVKNCNIFAWNRYGIDITIQLNKTKSIRMKNIDKIEGILRLG